MQGFVISFLIFSFFGIAMEVLFTAIGNFINSKEKDYSLKGHSYLWMFFIYGGIAIVFPPIYEILSGLNIFIRLLVYGVGILIAEFVIGYILEKIIGRCPWHYEKGFHINGLIRIDYLPLWIGFAYIVEQIYIFFNF